MPSESRTPRALIAVALSAATLAALTVATGPAHADPVGVPTYRTLAGTGSEPTADVLDGLANDPVALAVGGVRQVASYDPFGSADITTKDPALRPACTLPRPDGSDVGRQALLDSLNAGDGCLQFARSDNLNLAAAEPNLVYVPYAVENMSFAVTNTSAFPKNLSLTDLQGYFRCTKPSLLGGGSPYSGPNYRAMLPHIGSGTREFWAGLMYLGGVVPEPAPVCVQDGEDENAAEIEPANGTQVNNFEIVPFSVSSWVGQVAGVIAADLRGGVRIGQINSRSPFADNFEVQRELYNVIPQSSLTGSSVEDQRTREVFVGGSSLICTGAATPIIRRFGFRPRANCGNTGLITP